MGEGQSNTPVRKGRVFPYRLVEKLGRAGRVLQQLNADVDWAGSCSSELVRRKVPFKKHRDTLREYVLRGIRVLCRHNSIRVKNSFLRIPDREESEEAI
jgi:hypothetical protein